MIMPVIKFLNRNIKIMSILCIENKTCTKAVCQYKGEKFHYDMLVIKMSTENLSLWIPDWGWIICCGSHEAVLDFLIIFFADLFKHYH